MHGVPGPLVRKEFNPHPNAEFGHSEPWEERSAAVRNARPHRHQLFGLDGPPRTRLVLDWGGDHGVAQCGDPATELNTALGGFNRGDVRCRSLSPVRRGSGSTSQRLG